MAALKKSVSAGVWQPLLMDAKIYWDPFNGFFVIYCFRCFHPLPILRIRLIKLIRVVPGFNRNLTVPNNTVSYLILVELVLCWYSWIVTTRCILQFRLYFCWCNIFPSPVKGSLIWVVYLWEEDPGPMWDICWNAYLSLSVSVKVSRILIWPGTDVADVVGSNHDGF